MTSSQIKSLACVLMLIDHSGAILYPELDWPRVIGRLAFPLFAWLLANGWLQTSSRPAYFGRLLLFAVLSQLPYIIAFQPVTWRLNVFFSLAVGLCGLYWSEYSPPSLKWLGLAAFALLAELLRLDHGAYGILMIFCFGRYAGSYLEMIKAQLILLSLRQTIVYSLAYTGIVSISEWWVWAQPASIAALLLIGRYNGSRGKGAKYLFYWFYPAHLLLLRCLKWLQIV